MVWPARIEGREGDGPGLAARGRDGARRQHKALRCEKNDSRIPVLVRRNIGVMIRCHIGVVMMMRSSAVAMAMVVCTAVSQTAYVAGERIGEMDVVMRVIQTIHQRDVGLPRQHESQRHAEHGDHASKRGKSLPVQYDLVSGIRTRASIPYDGFPGNLAAD